MVIVIFISAVSRWRMCPGTRVFCLGPGYQCPAWVSESCAIDLSAGGHLVWHCCLVCKITLQ